MRVHQEQTERPGMRAVLMVKSGKDKRNNFLAEMQRISMSQRALQVAEIVSAKAKELKGFRC